VLGKENEANKIIAEKKAKLEEIKKIATIIYPSNFMVS